MANHRGSEGLIKVGSNQVAELRSFQISEESDLIEDSQMGDSTKTFQHGLKTWSGSADCWWDETDSNGQVALATVGSTITLNVYPEGATSGDTYMSGSALITGVEKSAAHDGMVEASVSFQGSGALTTSTV